MFSLLLCIIELDVSFSNTPTRRVMATVLKSPLIVINSKIEFWAHPVYEARNEPLMHDKVGLGRLSNARMNNMTILWLVHYSDECKQQTSSLGY